MNLYDCAFEGSATIGRRLLFGNENIGRPHLSNNVAIGNQFPDDTNLLVTNIYARTDAPPTIFRDLKAILNWATAEFLIGTKIYRTTSLAEFLDRVPDELLRYPPDEERVRRISLIENCAREADIRTDQVETVLKLAGLDRPRAEYFIPPRQTFGVFVTLTEKVTHFLDELVKKGNPVTVWVHLEGWMTRDFL
jgi:hypothetical protein